MATCSKIIVTKEVVEERVSEVFTLEMSKEEALFVRAMMAVFTGHGRTNIVLDSLREAMYSCGITCNTAIKEYIVPGIGYAEIKENK